MAEVNKFRDHAGLKTFCLGVQGSGKTEMAKQIAKHNKWRCLVYSPNVADWQNEDPNKFLVIDRLPKKEVDDFFKTAKHLKENDMIDAMIIDEFETIINTKWDMGENAIDYCANHRHWGENVDPEKHVSGGLALIGISRRPQDIPSVFVESANNIYVFTINGENVKKKLNSWEKGLGDKVANLEYKGYQYYRLELGKQAVKCDKIELI